jgi:glycerol-3-phosphate acyltransferase PlsY
MFQPILIVLSPYFWGIFLVCYLIGSLPTAYILVKLTKGIDVRTIGSGNVGATNAGRAAGRWAFFTVLALDALKGAVPIFILKTSSFMYYNPPIVLLLAALAILLGHMYPIYLKFTGGKGVATGLGVFFALSPISMAIALGVFIVVVLITKMISAGSIIASVALGISTMVFYGGWRALVIFTWIMAIVVIVKHRSNVGRILSGTENKINLGKTNK